MLGQIERLGVVRLGAARNGAMNIAMPFGGSTMVIWPSRSARHLPRLLGQVELAGDTANAGVDHPRFRQELLANRRGGAIGADQHVTARGGAVRKVRSVRVRRTRARSATRRLSNSTHVFETRQQQLAQAGATDRVRMSDRVALGSTSGMKPAVQVLGGEGDAARRRGGVRDEHVPESAGRQLCRARLPLGSRWMR